MKAPLLSLICAFALLFAACSKEEAPAPKEEARYSVTFNVNSLSHDIVPMQSIKPGGLMMAASSEKKLSEVITYLDYLVYDDEGMLIFEMNSQRTDSEFGQIKDIFGNGQYKVLVLGRRHPFYGYPEKYNNDSKLYTLGLMDEVFFEQFDLLVSDKDIELDVELKRKVGRVEIEITGKIPAEVGEIKYSISGVSDHFIPKTNRAANKTNQTRSVYPNGDGTFSTHDSGEPLNFYFFLDEDKAAKATVTLVAFDRQQNILAIKAIENVPVAVNRKTKLRGPLFGATGGVSGQAFSIGF